MSFCDGVIVIPMICSPYLDDSLILVQRVRESINSGHIMLFHTQSGNLLWQKKLDPGDVFVQWIPYTLVSRCTCHDI